MPEVFLTGQESNFKTVGVIKVKTLKKLGSLAKHVEKVSSFIKSKLQLFISK